MQTLSTPRLVNITALLVGAAGILIIFVADPGRFPPVPPGPIFLTVAAGVVAFVPGRWTPVVGVFVPLMIFVGGIVSGEVAEILTSPASAIALTGALVQLVANPIAVVAGTIGLIDQPQATQ